MSKLTPFNLPEEVGLSGGSDSKESAIYKTWAQSLGQEVTLEKRMAIHSSIRAWRIPWREKPGWL